MFSEQKLIKLKTYSDVVIFKYTFTGGKEMDCIRLKRICRADLMSGVANKGNYTQ